MKKALTIILIVVGVTGVLWVAQAWTLHRADPKITQFNAECDNLILSLQQYKQFTGGYPTGDNRAVIKALLGEGEKRILILTARRAPMNEKGEVVDPWGTPLQLYFSDNEVLLRSAGPNKAWEDSAAPISDDLFRCARMVR